MKCYVTNNSPYARKVRVVALEAGIYDEIEWKTITREDRGDIQTFNPLAKVPVAIVNEGDIICDSPVICAYVDELNCGRKMIPAVKAKRWPVLTLEALGDGLGEAVILYLQENQRPEEVRSRDVGRRHITKVDSALSYLDKLSNDFNALPLMGEIAVACALGYMEFRDAFPGWQNKYSNLSTWYSDIMKRNSFFVTVPK